jgi:DNA-binding GntR family transcriptional regulator
MSTEESDNFYRRFRHPAEPGLPKYAQLRRALIAAIEAGYWEPGAKLPTETELTRLTPFSLGTVQRGLRVLTDEGIIERRQGHGSFVARLRHEMEEPLHCRFLGDDGATHLPVFPRVLGRRRMTEPGPWTAYLGAGIRVFRIDRTINIGDEFSVFSSFYADSERLRPLLRLPIGALDAANFKLVMSRELRLPITEIEQQARVQPLPRRISTAIDVPPGTIGLKLEVAARAGSASFIYYQEIFIPPNRRALDVRSGGSTR